MNKFEYHLMDWVMGGPLNRFILGDRASEDHRYGVDNLAFQNRDKLRALVVRHLPLAWDEEIEIKSTQAAEVLFNHAARQVAGRANIKALAGTYAGMGLFFTGLFTESFPLFSIGLFGALGVLIPYSAVFQSVRPEYKAGKYEPGHKMIYELATQNIAAVEAGASLPKKVVRSLGFTQPVS